MTPWEGTWGQAIDVLGPAGQLEWGGVSQWGKSLDKPICFVQVSHFRQVQDTFMVLFLSRSSLSHQVLPAHSLVGSPGTCGLECVGWPQPWLVGI